MRLQIGDTGDVRLFWVIVLCAGCGRLGFDELEPGGGSLPSGLVAWYPMDDTANNTADVIGGVNGTCGTVQECPVPTEGHHGGAFMFDASKDCIEVPDIGQLPSTTFTVAIWGRVDAPDACAAFAKRVDVGGMTLNSWQIYTTSTNQVELVMNSGSTSPSKLVTADNVVTNGVWHHFAVTVDDSTRILYFDGMNMVSSPWTTTHVDSHSVWVGCDDQGGDVWSQHWRGALDDLQIYNRALSAAEIQMLASQ